MACDLSYIVKNEGVLKVTGSHVHFKSGSVLKTVHFSTKLVAMATSLEISEKEVQIVHLHPKRFHSVKRLQKSVQRILR